MNDVELIRALAVTAELCGTHLSEPAAMVLADDLLGYDRTLVLGALKRCRAELRGRLTLAEILARVDDGRPGPDEAFAMLPTTEAQTVVWTDEMAAASTYLDTGADRVTQRLAFREAYAKAVAKARQDKAPVQWWVSAGHDANGRERPVAEAVLAGRLDVRVAQALGMMTERTEAAQIEHSARAVVDPRKVMRLVRDVVRKNG